MVAITRPCSVTSSTSPFFTLDKYRLVGDSVHALPLSRLDVNYKCDHN